MADIKRIFQESEAALGETFRAMEETEYRLTEKILAAFREEHVSYRHFAGTTGYGYDDIGRDTLGRVLAKALGYETAIVRPQIASGTHALALCLYGVLRPGDVMLSAAGKPYDTLEEVIGISGAGGQGSLKELGIGYKQVELKDDRLDDDAVLQALTEDVKLVLIQRSRGYAWRSALMPEDITRLAKKIHEKSPSVCVMVDNCYGEFTCDTEPDVDLAAGSLNKNPGGGIAPAGGYIAGKAEFVEKVSYRLTSPGIGGEVGSYAGGYLQFYQGLFLAPHVTCQALKAAALAGEAFSRLGYPVSPAPDARRSDIIQAIEFGSEEKLVAFCRAIQANSPVDSDAVPEPWEMPGYQHKIVMAAGTFIGGASIELSADAPIKPPFIGYLQGGLTYGHVRAALMAAAEEIGGQ